MIKIDVNTSDINKLLLKVANLKDAFTEQEMNNEFGITASAISRRAKIDVPKKTGFLQSTINYGKDTNVFVQASAKYAGFVERGWKSKKGKKVGPFPYFYKNGETEIKLLNKRLTRKLNRII